MAVDRNILASMAIRLAVNSADMAKDLKKVSGHLDFFKNSLRSLGSMITATFSVGAVIAFGRSVYQAYQQQLMAEQQLLTALNGRKDVQQRLIRQAEYLQSTTLFEDDAIITLQKFLATLGMSELKIREVTEASTQLATAFGVDLDTAAKMLAKTYSGSVRELGRYIPEIKSMTKEQLKAGEAVAWVNENMKGLAETAANVDPIGQMKNSWSDFSEQLGKFVAPAVKGVTKALSELLKVANTKSLTFWDKLSALAPGNMPGFIAAKANIAAEEAIQQFEDEAKAIKEDTKAVEELVEAKKKLIEYNDLELGNWTRAIQSASTGLVTSWASPVGTPTSVGTTSAPSLGTTDAYAQMEANKAALVEYAGMMQQISDEFSYALNNIFTEVAVSFGTMLGNLISSGQAFDSSAALNGIASMMEQLGELAVAAGVTTLGIKASLESLNGYVAIAAGIALIALAQSVRNAASNIASGTGSANISSYEAQQTSLSVKRNLGDNDVLTIKVVGKIDGNDIRLSNERATKSHNYGN